MGKSYRSDREDNYSSYVDFHKKKIKTNKIKNFLDKKSVADKHEYLDKHSKPNTFIDDFKD